MGCESLPASRAQTSPGQQRVKNQGSSQGDVFRSLLPRQQAPQTSSRFAAGTAENDEEVS